mgnify:CR=1 FL=1
MIRFIYGDVVEMSWFREALCSLAVIVMSDSNVINRVLVLAHIISVIHERILNLRVIDLI